MNKKTNSILSVQEIADALGKHKMTVYQMLHKGTVKKLNLIELQKLRKRFMYKVLENCINPEQFEGAVYKMYSQVTYDDIINELEKYSAQLREENAR